MANPQLQYLVAFNNNASDDPNLITTIASPPGALGAANVWTDVTRWVVDDSGNRGRQHEIGQFDAGDRILTLRNDDGRFTSWNTSGPYTPLVVPRKPFRVQATWLGVTYIRFTGQVYSWQPNWPDPAQKTITLSVADGHRMFNSADITTGGYEAQVLADGASGFWELGDPVGSPRAADSGPHGYTATMNGTVIFGQTGALVAETATAANFGTAPTPAAFLNLPGAAAPTGTAYTIELWVNVSTWTFTGDGMMVEWYDAGFVDSTVFWVAGSGDMQFQSTNGVTTMYQAANVAIPTGGWHHIAVTRSGATVVMYIDGAAVSSTVTTPGNPAGITATGGYIGADIGVPDFAGNMQFVAIYPTALSAGQIAAHYNLATWSQEATGARINRVLNAIGWSSGARAIDTGTSTVQKVTGSLTNTSSLNHMQQVEATEGGALFMTNDGKVRFYSRTSLQSSSFTTTNQAVFGDNTAGGDIPFLPGPGPVRDDIDLYNEAVATRTGGITQITDNAASIAANGRQTWNPPASLIGISDLEVLAETQYIVARYGTPTDRLAQIVVDLTAVAAAFPSVIPTLLSLELLDQVLIERTIMPGGGTAFSQVNDIEHISETIKAADGTWLITFGMAVADVPFWILGTSQLGTNTTIAW